MIYKKESCNMLVIALIIYGFIGLFLYGLCQGAAFFDE